MEGQTLNYGKLHQKIKNKNTLVALDHQANTNACVTRNVDCDRDKYMVFMRTRGLPTVSSG